MASIKLFYYLLRNENTFTINQHSSIEDSRFSELIYLIVSSWLTLLDMSRIVNFILSLNVHIKREELTERERESKSKQYNSVC